MAIKFIKSIIKNPRSMGTIVPSSRWLGSFIASNVNPESQKTLIVEIGPGTGSITEFLVKKLNANHRLVAIDINPDFLQLLSNKFPNIRCVSGSVEELLNITEEEFAREPFEKLILVSSLPLRLFNEKLYAQCILTLETIFSRFPKTELFQYSYGKQPPINTKILVPKYVGIVFLNFPPARVWKYTVHNGT